MSNLQRKLSIILIADVVGFSKLMGQDEAATLADLKASREIIDAAISRHHGRIFGSAGDNLVAEFSSPVEAVSCAAEFQELLAARNEDRDATLKMRFRVGINMGDVIIDGDNLFGDGVNVAARLEAIARPGGVCVSYKVHDEVRRKLDLLFVDGGARQLKNIDEPVAVFHLGSDAEGGETSKQPSGHAKPLIQVHPIKVVGRDTDIEALAEGLREVIISGLAAQTALAVTRDDAGNEADFVLDGGVRGSGKKIRVNFTLHDQAGGTEVWAERYERTLEDLFELEDEISSSVVSVVRVRLKALEMARLENTDNAGLNVGQLLSKAAGYFVRSPGDNEAVQEILDLALQQQPENSMAHAMMVLCLWRLQEYSPMRVSAADQDRMGGHIQQALELDPNSFFALLIAAILREDFAGDYRAALDYVEHALQINPNFTQAQATAGIAKCYLGNWQEGYKQLSQAIEANKEDPHRFRHQRELALVLAMQGQMPEAADVMRRLLRQAPDLCRNGLISAGIYGQAGAAENARHCVQELLARYPELTQANMREIHFLDAGQKQNFIAALSAAGLPEA